MLSLSNEKQILSVNEAETFSEFRIPGRIEGNAFCHKYYSIFLELDIIDKMLLT